MTFETVFTMDTSSIKVGRGATRELGHDMRALGARRVLLLTDPNVARTPAAAVAMDSLRAAGIDTVLYDRVRVEPTENSASAMPTPHSTKNFQAASTAAGVPCTATISTEASVAISIATHITPRLSATSARNCAPQKTWKATW
ncbi:iron-containing alcohol dehydrogenase [Leptolyngbya sp. 15MV]|nr:iron-containing alcohol dehydrogenase [Leptolyngbya sp. 15MV]